MDDTGYQISYSLFHLLIVNVIQRNTQNLPRKNLPQMPKNPLKKILIKLKYKMKNFLKIAEVESGISISSLIETIATFFSYGLLLGLLSEIGIDFFSRNQFQTAITEPISLITFSYLSIGSIFFTTLVMVNERKTNFTIKKSKFRSIAIPVSNAANSAGFIIIGMSFGLIVGSLFMGLCIFAIALLSLSQYNQAIVDFTTLWESSCEIIKSYLFPFSALQFAIISLQLSTTSEKVDEHILKIGIFIIILIIMIIYFIRPELVINILLFTFLTPVVICTGTNIYLRWKKNKMVKKSP